MHFPRQTPPEIRTLMRRMSLREMAGQLLVIPFYGDNPASKHREYQEFVRQVKQNGVGGLILLNRVQNGQVRRAEPMAVAAFLNRMQKEARVPLIVGGDFERGSSMRLNGPAQFPHAMAFGAANDLAATRALGEATARESRAMGFHWVFAPVADVNNNPNNPIINTRSFGENPQLVAAHVKAFIEGAHAARRNGILVTVKHFPGHGDTATDTHFGLAKITGDRARLDTVELVPFQAALAAGVDGVMMGHLAVPALEEKEIPATISVSVIQGLLRKELGFDGLTVTDAMDMQGLSRQFPPGEAAVRALEAGAQVLLVPPNPDAAIKGITDAITSGRLPAERLHNAVAHVLMAKQRLGLFQKRLVDLENVSEHIDAPELTDLAQSVAEKALALLKNEGGQLPLRADHGACLVALAEGRNSTSGRRLIDEVQRRAPKMKTLWVEPSMKAPDLEEAAGQLNGCSAIVVASFVSVSSARGDVSLPASLTGFVEGLFKTNTPITFCALGSPYILRNFPQAAGQVATFSSTATSEAALARGLFGEVAMRAKPPVTVVSAP
jgi:beta-N-acetylhexosaminidase